MKTIYRRFRRPETVVQTSTLKRHEVSRRSSTSTTSNCAGPGVPAVACASFGIGQIDVTSIRESYSVPSVFDLASERSASASSLKVLRPRQQARHIRRSARRGIILLQTRRCEASIGVLCERVTALPRQISNDRWLILGNLVGSWPARRSAQDLAAAAVRARRGQAA